MGEMDVGEAAETPPPGMDSASAGGGALAGIAVVVAAIVLLTGVASPHFSAATPTSGGPGSGPVVPALNVTSAQWGGSNASVNDTSCPHGCAIGLALGATFTYNLTVRADCDTFGCATTVTAVDLQKPFLLLSTSPALPDRFTANTTTLALSVKAPSTVGNYTLQGTVVAGGLPAVVQVSGTSWSFSYSDVTAGSFATAPTNTTSVTVAGGSTFSVTVPVTASNGTAIQVSGFTPPNGFAALSVAPLGTFSVLAGTTQNFTVLLRAPAYNWSGALTGTIATTVLASVVDTGYVTIDVNPFYQPNWTITPSNISTLQPGGTFYLYATFQGGLDVSYQIAYTSYASSPNVVLLSVTPTGTQTVNSASVTFTLKFQLPDSGGDFHITLGFTET